jgi:hypothetical protein
MIVHDCEERPTACSNVCSHGRFIRIFEKIQMPVRARELPEPTGTCSRGHQDNRLLTLRAVLHLNKFLQPNCWIDSRSNEHDALQVVDSELRTRDTPPALDLGASNTNVDVAKASLNCIEHLRRDFDSANSILGPLPLFP